MILHILVVKYKYIALIDCANNKYSILFCLEKFSSDEDDINSIFSSGAHSSPSESSPALSNSCEATSILPNVCATHISCLHCFGDLASPWAMQPSSSFMNPTERYFVTLNLSIAIARLSQYLSNFSINFSPPLCIDIGHQKLTIWFNILIKSCTLRHTSSPHSLVNILASHLWSNAIVLLLKILTPMDISACQWVFLLTSATWISAPSCPHISVCSTLCACPCPQSTRGGVALQVQKFPESFLIIHRACMNRPPLDDAAHTQKMPIWHVYSHCISTKTYHQKFTCCTSTLLRTNARALHLGDQ